jgi:hypothetical protein
MCASPYTGTETSTDTNDIFMPEEDLIQVKHKHKHFHNNNNLYLQIMSSLVQSSSQEEKNEKI